MRQWTGAAGHRWEGATAATLLAMLVCAPPNAAAGKTSPHPARARPTPIHGACPEALSDGALVDAGIEEPLAALAGRVKWDGAQGPTRCQRKVRLHCGPDLDRDGSQEAIVEITSLDAGDGQTCDAAIASSDPAAAPLVRRFFLVSRRQAGWQVAASSPLAVSVDDGDVAPARPSVYFVRQPDGAYAVRVDSYVAHGACEVGGYEVFGLRGGALVQLGRGDLSAPCAPCACH